MRIQRRFTGGRGVFLVEENGKVIAGMTVRVQKAATMIILHTEVSSKYRGGGIGKELVEAAVKYAREKHLKVSPVCPFAKSVLKSSAEYRDVL